VIASFQALPVAILTDEEKRQQKNRNGTAGLYRCHAPGNDADSADGRATPLLDIPGRNTVDRIRIIVCDDGAGIPKKSEIYRIASLGLKLICSTGQQPGGTGTITGNRDAEVINEIFLPIQEK